MKKSFILVAALITFAMQATAQTGVFYDTAHVTNVQPLTQQVPIQDCSQQTQQPQVYGQQNPQPRSNNGSLIGGIAGALLGNTVGKGNGKVAATAVGGIVGAITGDRLENQQPQPYSNGNNNGYNNGYSSCVTRYVDQQVGYLIFFEYQGRQGSKRMSYNPGQTVRVAVSVDPQ